MLELAQVVSFCFAVGLADDPTKPGNAAIACVKTRDDCEKMRTEILKDGRAMVGPCYVRDADQLGPPIMTLPNRSGAQ
jgi:hypothetical protein